MTTITASRFDKLMPWLIFLLICGTQILLNQDFFFHNFTLPITGDMSSNDMLTYRAKEFRQFHGNYSRVGLYHPGPFYFQWMAIFEIIIHDVLGITASPNASHILGMLVLAALSLTALVWLFWLMVRSWPYAISSLLITLSGSILHCASSNPFLVNWPPLLYLIGTWFFAAGMMAVWRISFAWLPLAVFGGMQLIHGHASFIAIVPIATLVFFSFYAFRHYAEKKHYAWVAPAPALPEKRVLLRTAIFSFLMIGLFLLPIILETILHWPGQIPKYFAQSSRQYSYKYIDTLKYIGQFFPLYGVPLLALLIPNRSKSERAKQLRELAVVVLVSFYIAAFFYARKGVDTYDYGYLLWWFGGAVGVAYALIAMYALQALAFPRIISGLLLLAMLGLSAGNLEIFTHESKYYSSETSKSYVKGYEELKTQLSGLQPQRFPVHVNHNKKEFIRSIWAFANLLALQRRDDKMIFCAPAAEMDVGYMMENQCTPEEEQNAPYALSLLSNMEPAPADARLLTRCFNRYKDSPEGHESTNFYLIKTGK